MIKYDELGYKTFEEYQEDFLRTLLKSNQTYDYFVDWEKVLSYLEKHIIEINILNSLSKISSEKVEAKFTEIIFRYPETIELIPIILAISHSKRKDEIVIINLEDITFENFDFTENTSINAKKVLNFCRNTGVLSLFTKINDLYTYLVGTEVGLNTNARKNRSGTIFEDLISELFEEKIKENKNWSIKYQHKLYDKTFDVVLYYKDDPKILTECNFYSGSGSKPSEIVRSYIGINEKIKNTESTFLWITDGLGWNKMQIPLNNALNNINYVVNYNILKKNIDQIMGKFQN